MDATFRTKTIVITKVLSKALCSTSSKNLFFSKSSIRSRSYVSLKQYLHSVVHQHSTVSLPAQSREIRQRLLENKTLRLDQAFEQACILEMAQRHSATYSNPDFHIAAADTAR